MTKWAVELAEHDIGYQSRTAIKAQALADFLAEGASLSVAESSSLPEEVRSEEPWVLFVDGASNKEGSGAGLLLTSPTGEELTYGLKFDFAASNNEAEYETLLTGLRIVHQMSITAIKVRSAEITEQAHGRSVKTGILLVCSPEQGGIGGGSQAKKHRPGPNLGYRQPGLLDDSPRGFPQLGCPPRGQNRDPPTPTQSCQLKCVTFEEGDYVLREVHESLYTTHVGFRVLAKKCLFLGYYWPSVFRDAAALVQQCRACQGARPAASPTNSGDGPHPQFLAFSPVENRPSGAFSQVFGRYEHLVVAIDYFTKWMEAEPLATISGKFAENPFKDWCAELGINQHFTSVGHPQANGQVENVNRIILQGLKTRLELAQSNWLEELPSVL
ncbi:uncharacterized protein [Coffea arabica]|uniref:Integrase catalytic domain-containing protein n=1 Tax=Coffea arabica TaxID=13443 RepID=A0ABM4WMH7_COFAR